MEPVACLKLKITYLVHQSLLTTQLRMNQSVAKQFRRYSLLQCDNSTFFFFTIFLPFTVWCLPQIHQSKQPVSQLHTTDRTEMRWFAVDNWRYWHGGHFSTVGQLFQSRRIETESERRQRCRFQGRRYTRNSRTVENIFTRPGGTVADVWFVWWNY